MLVPGVALVLVANVVLMRRVFGPLERLTALMRRVDPLAPGQRVELTVPWPRWPSSASRSTTCSTGSSPAPRQRPPRARRAGGGAQADGARAARRVGQTLTGVVLQLESLERTAPDELRAPLRSLEASARAAIEEVRELVRRLRPEALDDFGLRSALVSLGSELAEHSGLRVSPDVSSELPALSKEDELVVYRVAQESLVNVARHARATRADVSLAAENGSVVLRVRDDGRGIDAAGLRSGHGVRGMRERALLSAATSRSCASLHTAPRCACDSR